MSELLSSFKDFQWKIIFNWPFLIVLIFLLTKCAKCRTIYKYLFSQFMQYKMIGQYLLQLDFTLKPQRSVKLNFARGLVKFKPFFIFVAVPNAAWR